MNMDAGCALKAVLVGILSLGVVGGVTGYYLPSMLNQYQTKLQTKVDQRLNAEGGHGLKAVVTGRDVTIYAENGQKPDQATVERAVVRIRATKADFVAPKPVEAYAQPVSAISVSDTTPPVSVMRDAQTAEAVAQRLLDENLPAVAGFVSTETQQTKIETPAS